MPSRGLSTAVALATALLGARAHAGGFELVEQGPEAVATAGAQTADVDAPAAVYYDPAALVFQPGTSAQAGADLRRLSRHRDAAGRRGRLRRRRSTPRPRCSAACAWRRATPSASASTIRSPGRSPIPPAGPDASPASRSTCARSRSTRRWPCARRRGSPSGSASTWCRRRCRTAAPPRSPAAPKATLAVGVSGTGVGGNASILVRAVPRWLDVAVAYRSAVVVDLASSAARATLPLPHAFSFALASRPLARPHRHHRRAPDAVGGPVVAVVHLQRHDHAEGDA